MHASFAASVIDVLVSMKKPAARSTAGSTVDVCEKKCAASAEKTGPLHPPESPAVKSGDVLSTVAMYLLT